VAGGTSAAAPFVTGAMALVWSLAPRASAAELRLAFLHARGEGRTSVTPPLLDAEAAYRTLAAAGSRH
jgi:subtilisin family serine protease